MPSCKSRTPEPLDILRQFRRIFSAVKQNTRNFEDSGRISGAQWWALSIVARHPGLRVSELAAAMAVHQSTTSNLVERLAELALVERQRATEDQRVVRLFPTPAGQRIVDQDPQPSDGVLPDALKRISPEQLATLHDILGLLIADLTPFATTPDHGRHC
jgi:DNA-binding MarR family transcriptional regulator